MFQMKKGSKVVKNFEMWMNEWIKCTQGDNNYDNNFIDFRRFQYENSQYHDKRNKVK